MKRKRKSTGIIAFAVFVAVICVGGYALSTSGYTDNPFDQIAFLSNWASGGEQRFERQFGSDAAGNAPLTLGSAGVDAAGDTAADSDINLADLSSADTQFQLPALDSTDSASATDSTDAPGRRGGDGLGGGFGEGNGGGQGSIDWSDIGDVFYNLWFIAATTAVFIVVQQLFKFVIRQLKRRAPSAAAAV